MSDEFFNFPEVKAILGNGCRRSPDTWSKEEAYTLTMIWMAHLFSRAIYEI